MNCVEIMTGWLVQSHFFCSWKFFSRRVRDQIRGFRQIGVASMQEVKETMRVSSSIGRDCSLEGFEQEPDKVKKIHFLWGAQGKDVAQIVQI